jgi:hypothetical protein
MEGEVMPHRLSEPCRIYIIGLLDKFNFNNFRSVRWSYIVYHDVEHFSDGSLKLIVQENHGAGPVCVFMANWTLGISKPFIIGFSDLEQDMMVLKAAYAMVLNNA